MRRLALLLFIAAVTACSREEPRPLSEPGEKLYPMRATIVSRDAADNSLRLRHEKIEGFMDAMTMDFNVRGAEVGELPPDGSRVLATLHVTERSYWVTDVRAATSH